MRADCRFQNTCALLTDLEHAIDGTLSCLRASASRRCFAYNEKNVAAVRLEQTKWTSDNTQQLHAPRHQPESQTANRSLSHTPSINAHHAEGIRHVYPACPPAADHSACSGRTLAAEHFEVATLHGQQPQTPHGFVKGAPQDTEAPQLTQVSRISEIKPYF